MTQDHPQAADRLSQDILSHVNITSCPKQILGRPIKKHLTACLICVRKEHVVKLSQYQARGTGYFTMLRAYQPILLYKTGKNRLIWSYFARSTWILVSSGTLKIQCVEFHQILYAAAYYRILQRGPALWLEKNSEQPAGHARPYAGYWPDPFPTNKLRESHCHLNQNTFVVEPLLLGWQIQVKRLVESHQSL